MLRRLWRRTRRNHALEHATINILSRRYPQAQVVGLSSPSGFTLYTNLTTEEVMPAVQQGLELLKSGRHRLGIHQQCGTNLIVMALLTMVATLLGMGASATTWRRRLERMPQTVLLNALAIFLARPLGEWVQANVTTDPSIEAGEIASVFTDNQGKVRRIRVHTRSF